MIGKFEWEIGDVVIARVGESKVVGTVAGYSMDGRVLHITPDEADPIRDDLALDTEGKWVVSPYKRWATVRVYRDDANEVAEEVMQEYPTREEAEYAAASHGFDVVEVDA